MEHRRKSSGISKVNKLVKVLNSWSIKQLNMFDREQWMQTFGSSDRLYQQSTGTSLKGLQTSERSGASQKPAAVGVATHSATQRKGQDVQHRALSGQTNQ